jgi:hypothetical protein
MVAAKKKVASDRWDTSNWTAGKVTIFQALGITKGKLDWPKYQANLSQAGTASAKTTSTTTTGTTTSSGDLGATEKSNQTLGKQLAQSFGWGTGSEWDDLNQLVMDESGWDNTAQNPTSTAYGIGQFLDTTWATVGGTKTSSPQTQINLMLLYIKMRYGSPSAALAHENEYHWY